LFYIVPSTKPQVQMSLCNDNSQGFALKPMSIFHDNHDFFEMEGNKSNQKTKKYNTSWSFSGGTLSQSQLWISLKCRARKANNVVPLFLCVVLYFSFVVLHCPLHNPTSSNVLELSNSEVCSRGCQFSTQSQSSNKFSPCGSLSSTNRVK
jgi:hypothetical protein